VEIEVLSILILPEIFQQILHFFGLKFSDEDFADHFLITKKFGGFQLFLSFPLLMQLIPFSVPRERLLELPLSYYAQL